MVLEVIDYATLGVEGTYMRLHIVMDTHRVDKWKDVAYKWWAEKAQPVKTIKEWQVSGYDSRFNRAPTPVTSFWNMDVEKDPTYYTLKKLWRSTRFGTTP
jgi:hypothetical protein